MWQSWIFWKLRHRSTSELAEPQRREVADLLHRYEGVFSLPEKDLGRANSVTHHIDTGTTKPIKQQARRTSPLRHAEIKRQVDHLLDRGLVKKSSSPLPSPVVLITKKDATPRDSAWATYRSMQSQLKMTTFFLAEMTLFLLFLERDCSQREI